MPTIQHLYNRTVTVRRMSGVYAGKKSLSTVTSDYPCHIQKETRNSVIDRYGVDGAEYTAWMDVDNDIKRDDQVTDGSNGEIYSVTAVIKQGQDIAMNEHMELILRKYNTK